MNRQNLPFIIISACILVVLPFSSALQVVNTYSRHRPTFANERTVQTYQGDVTCENGGIKGQIGLGPTGCLCNNSSSTYNAAYAGLRCEYIATDYCVFGLPVSVVAFCVNYGICNDIIIDQSKGHPGCQCPPQFEGPHCEYARGTTPVWVLDPAKASEEAQMENRPLSPGIIVIITIFSIAAFAGMVSIVLFMVQKGHFRFQTRSTLNQTNFTALEQGIEDSDGSCLKENVEMQNSIAAGRSRAKKKAEDDLRILKDVEII
mmetsp:Transcript_19208/g.27351  ORF Transcript_19208/g.27351 Transcript_19208/m.27351 type:complete len:261 (-) Transcript_19208:293-1075(-)